MSLMVKWCSLLLLLISSFGYIGKIGAQSCPSNSWEIFRDEHCYRIYDREKNFTYSNGERQCIDYYEASFPLIRSRIEQDAVNNYLFTKLKIVNNVWLGAKYHPLEKKFKWTDGTDLIFTNWQAGYPKLDLITDYCVQLNADKNNLGKWIDVPCVEKTLVACQKEQSWSNAYLKTIVQQLRQNLTSCNCAH